MSAPDEINESLTPGEREVQAALSKLRPLSRSNLDAVAVAFDAGQRSGRRSLATWRAAAAMLLIALSVNVLMRFGNADVPTSTPTPTPIARASPAAAASDEAVKTELATYYALRNDVIARGVAALPDSAGGSTVRPMPIRGGVASDRL
jgi:hypothetical protein